MWAQRSSCNPFNIFQKDFVAKWAACASMHTKFLFC